MKTFLKIVVLLLMVPFARAEFSEGVEYQALAAPQPTSTGDKIEVLELFWYSCPHCYHLEPTLATWLKSQPEDVEFVRMPAILGANWELLARAYYTAEMLDAEDKIHTPLFEHLHKERKRIRDVAGLQAFFEEQGISKGDFQNTYNSFAVVMKTRRSAQVGQLYGISGVPALIVNGKYMVNAGTAGGNDKMLEVVDFLVAKERAVGKHEGQAGN